VTLRRFVFLAVLASSCGGGRDDAAPVASATVSISPSQAAPGAPVEVQYKLEALAGGTLPAGTHVLFVHAVDADGKVLWTDDHEPPQAVETWKPGAPSEYARTMFVPRTTPPGPLQIVVGLYAPATGARVALRGESTEPRAYKVATLEVGPDPSGAFVAYTEGWHNPEANETLGREWRWSKGTGHLAFRNPMKAADLWVELDQPVPALASPQQVEIRVGGAVLDSFALESHQPVVRRVAIAQEAMGTGDTVDVEIAPRQSFVPAAIPALKSDDRRELGVRVFNAYLALK
jgi:hypothetical protein